MNHLKTLTLLVGFVWCFFGASPSSASAALTESQRLVTFRAMGNDILMLDGDSTSRVMPVQKEDGRYRISFEHPFAFDPDAVIAAIQDRVIREELAQAYLVEFMDCAAGQVVYSYQRTPGDQLDEISCRSRLQPSGCYFLYFTIMDSEEEEDQASLQAGTWSGTFQPSGWIESFGMPWLLVLSLLLLAFGMAGIRYFRRAKSPELLIPIGVYHFDRKKMLLRMEKEKIELTSKEAELLGLLHASANETIERNEILKQVWGDDGDYVGRTLDVFVSKLRKKLEADPNVKIANIRGVGYRLIC